MKKEIIKNLEELSLSYINAIGDITSTQKDDKENLEGALKCISALQEESKAKNNAIEAKKQLELKERELDLKEKELKIRYEEAFNKKDEIARKAFIEEKATKIEKIKIIGGGAIAVLTLGFKIISLIQYRKMGNVALLAEYKDNMIVPRDFKDSMNNINSLIKQ